MITLSCPPRAHFLSIPYYACLYDAVICQSFSFYAIGLAHTFMDAVRSAQKNMQARNWETKRSFLLRITKIGMIANIQGDHSGGSRPPVDIITKVVF